ncbi:MAG: cobalamin biosynthesis protein [Myxococcales bacterium]
MIQQRKPYAIYAITRHGLKHAARLVAALPDADVYVSEKLLAGARELPSLAEARPLPLPMGPLLRDTWKAYDCHVHVISVGAVVRMVAPLLANKKIDPAVLCVDDTARFAICVLSGHVGRGNAFTERVAEALGATPVITTASDAIGTLTVDILGRDLGWTLDDMDRNVTRGCAAVVNQARVLFVHEAGDAAFWPLDKALPPGVEYALGLEGVDPGAFEILLIASDRDVARSHPAHFDNSVVYRPKSLVLGLGCDRNTPLALIERGIDKVLADQGLSAKSVRAMASIDKKSDEPGLLALSEKRGWPLTFYTAEELDSVPDLQNPSATVLRHVGTRGVCEPAARLLAGAERVIVPKTVYTEDGAGRSMTVAVARVPFQKREEASRE